MPSTPSHFVHIHAPDQNFIGADPIDFLRNLKQPAWITLEGRDTHRSRAIVTLLHGNEPSGLKAVHSFLKSGIKPATNLGIFIVSVDAALYPPLFSHRYLPEEQDFNRCFVQPADTEQKRLAANILETLRAFSPEAIVDTHNTSAHSEAFAVATSSTPAMFQLSQIFTQHLVILDLKLGTLIEQELSCPVVTIEFGGFLDQNADQLAIDKIHSFITLKQLFNDGIQPLQLLEHPLRLEVSENCKLHYSSSISSNVEDQADVTIFNTIDQLNFTQLTAGTNLGWLGPSGLEKLRVQGGGGDNIAAELFEEKDGFLRNIRPMTIFMATTDAYIASHDCLLYLCGVKQT